MIYIITTFDLKIKGKNIFNFIKKLHQNNIEILKIKYLKYNEIIITIKKEDYETISKLKNIYEIKIIKINGLDKIKNDIKKNIYLIISIIISILILYSLSNTIFSVEVIHNDDTLKQIILEELEKNDIKKYRPKKSYKELTKIKKEILEKYKDKIEWLEIENVGTKYMVKLEERIINKNKQIEKYQNIVAKKDALLTKIDANEGEIQKEINEYVHKGDIIISGEIKLYDEIKNKVSAKGTIYGETWYKITIEYPLNIKRIKKTGKKKILYTLKLLNKKISLFDFKKYKIKKQKEKIILKHNFLPISLIKEEQYELVEYDKKLTKEEALKEAEKEGITKLKERLKEKEYINDIKKLKIDENNSKIILELFISVIEDITDYAEIIEGE